MPEKTRIVCKVKGTVVGMEIHEQMAISAAKIPIKTISLVLFCCIVVVFMFLTSVFWKYNIGGFYCQ